VINCDNDVSILRRTGYMKYHWTDVGCWNVHAPVTQAVYVTGFVCQYDSAPNTTQYIFGTTTLKLIVY